MVPSNVEGKLYPLLTHHAEPRWSSAYHTAVSATPQDGWNFETILKKIQNSLVLVQGKTSRCSMFRRFTGDLYHFIVQEHAVACQGVLGYPYHEPSNLNNSGSFYVLMVCGFVVIEFGAP